MEELFYYLDKVKEELDRSEVMKKFSISKKEVYNNEKLVKLIKEYHNNYSEDIKKQIIDFPCFREYKKNENEVNFLILEINNILKKIVNKGSDSCCE